MKKKCQIERTDERGEKKRAEMKKDEKMCISFLFGLLFVT